MLEYYTAYVLAYGGKERITGIMAVSEEHARSIASIVWEEKHGVNCFFCIQVRLDDLN